MTRYDRPEMAPDSPAGRLHTAYDEQFGDGLAALAAIKALREDLMECEDHAALTARKSGWSWQQIGEVMGTSRQAAHQRWGRIAEFAGWTA
jgi:hypothetical protein